MAISVWGSNRGKNMWTRIAICQKRVIVYQTIFVHIRPNIYRYFLYAIEIKLEIKCKTTLFFLNRQLYNVRFLRVENSKAHNATAVGFWAIKLFKKIHIDLYSEKRRAWHFLHCNFCKLGLCVHEVRKLWKLNPL